MWRELAEMAQVWRDARALDGTMLRGLAGPTGQTPLAQAVERALRAPGHGVPAAAAGARASSLSPP